MPVLNFLESFTDGSHRERLIVATNSAANRMFGFAPGTAKGQRLTSIMPEPYKSQHDGYLFRHEKFGSEKLIGKTRTLKGERFDTHAVFSIQLSLGRLPVKGYFIATIRRVTDDAHASTASDD